MHRSPHNFHIPVMGLGFTIDSPVKVARFGITSVVSIMDDVLIENMRKALSNKYHREYLPISSQADDYRALRITAYLNLLDEIIKDQVVIARQESVTEESVFQDYFSLLEDIHPLKNLYRNYCQCQDVSEKSALASELRNNMLPGDIEVNIMSKADRDVYDENGTALPAYHSNASASLRGYINSNVSGGVVFSAGFNPRLYNYAGELPQFKPRNGQLPSKHVILKVSDYRSALVQGKYLAKKGILVKEFRIESGLNCGGHAFPTDGQMMGPVLEEFKSRLPELKQELLTLCNEQLVKAGYETYSTYNLRLSAQGGVGTYEEHRLLLDSYTLDSVGWGSPFLLVPEATNLDSTTLKQLSEAKPDDFYLSNASPLGIMFNNFKPSGGQAQLNQRIEKGRPGSPCVKKFLAFNTEFTKEPICVASRQYLELKLNQLKSSVADMCEYVKQASVIQEKECLCEGLAIGVERKNQVANPRKPQGESVCPGPNLAYFSGTYTLAEMVGHIYGRWSLLNDSFRPHLFVNEMKLNLDYLIDKINKVKEDASCVPDKLYAGFVENLKKSEKYYKTKFNLDCSSLTAKWDELLGLLENEVQPA